MRGKGEGEGAKEVGSVEGGGPHLVKARSRRVVEHTLSYHEPGGKGFRQSCTLSSSLDAYHH